MVTLWHVLCLSPLWVRASLDAQVRKTLCGRSGGLRFSLTRVCSRFDARPCSCRIVKTHRKQEVHGPQSSTELQFQIAITWFLDCHENSCTLDLKLHYLLTCLFSYKPWAINSSDQECYKWNLSPTGPVAIGLPSYGLHKCSLRNLSKGCNSKNERKHTRLIEDFSVNISIKVLLKYLQWLGSKCHFSTLPIISIWKLQVVIAFKLIRWFS